MADERRQPFDLAAYVDRVRSSPCFICRIADGIHDQPTHIVYRDDRHIVFLPNFHVLHGYALVAPLEHRKAVASDFTEADRLRQRVAGSMRSTNAPMRSGLSGKYVSDR